MTFQKHTFNDRKDINDLQVNYRRETKILKLKKYEKKLLKRFIQNGDDRIESMNLKLNELRRSNLKKRKKKNN